MLFCRQGNKTAIFLKNKDSYIRNYKKFKGYLLLVFHVIKPAMRTPDPIWFNSDFVIM